jgi:hypothetical protein
MIAEFINALLDDREPEIDVYKALAMTVPGIIGHQSALKHGGRMKVPSIDRGQASRVRRHAFSFRDFEELAAEHGMSLNHPSVAGFSVMLRNGKRACRCEL